MQLLHKIGVPKKWNVIDVYGLDSDLLAVLPRPVLSMILLYPLSDKVGWSFYSYIEKQHFIQFYIFTILFYAFVFYNKCFYETKQQLLKKMYFSKK